MIAFILAAGPCTRLRPDTINKHKCLLEVFDNKKAVATARHRKTANGYKLERFAVLESERGKKYGNIVLKAILDDLQTFNGMIYMHAQSEVLPFYEKMGFIKEGKEFEEAGIMHFKMTFNC